MIIESVKLGSINIDEKEIYTFSEGLYGWENNKRFVLITPDQSLPFTYLQSIEDKNVCLLMFDPFLTYKNYELELADKVKTLLLEPSPEDVYVLVTTSIRETLEDATVNLLAPLVFNTKKRVGAQVILHESRYETRAPLFPQEQGGTR